MAAAKRKSLEAPTNYDSANPEAFGLPPTPTTPAKPATPVTPQTPRFGRLLPSQQQQPVDVTPRRNSGKLHFGTVALPSPAKSLPESPTSNAQSNAWARRDRSRTPSKNLRGDDAYLTKLLSLCQREDASLRRTHRAMADFLASFNFEDDVGIAPAKQQFEEVEGIQLQLQSLIAGKASETRAEHVSTRLELSPNTQISLRLTTSENEALEGLNGVDPSLGGVQTSSLPGETDVDVFTRMVVLSDAITHQPQNEPVLQRAIAKHLTNALSVVDDSNWAVREVSRDTAGWKFVYLCRDSLKHWNRQSKSQAKMLVAEYTLKDLDPTVLNRPAFDCRGSLTIFFSRTSRAVIIDYEHTPMHKTVAELKEHFKRPPRVLGPGAQKLKLQKAPKQPEGEKTPKKQKTPKTKTPKEKTLGEKVERKKRPRESGQEGATPRKRKKKSNAGDVADGYVSAAAGQNGEGGQNAQQAAWSINITPQEAQRRKDNATKMLSEAGVDPVTLSLEQFNIFANQSPDLQKESLAMLAKYGAERLRIVHPAGAKTTGSSPSATPAQSTPPDGTGSTTTEELVPTHRSGGKRNKGGSRKSIGVTETPVAPPVPTSGATHADTPTKQRKMGKSRTACFSCKNRKVKCPRERPVCAECEHAGLTCEYAPQKPRKSRKSEATVAEDDGEEEDQDELDNQLQEETQGHESTGQTSYNQMPVADMLTANSELNSQPLDNQSSSLFQSSSNLNLPSTVSQFSQQTITTPSGLVLPYGQIYNNTGSSTGGGLSLPQEAPKETPVPIPQPVTSPRTSRRSARGTAAGSRKSLPTGSQMSPPQKGAEIEPSSAWGGLGSGMTPATTSQSSILAPQQQSRASNQRIVTNSPQQTLTQTAGLQAQHQQAHDSPSLAAASHSRSRNSPFQSVSKRSSSRQGHRSGPSMTPVTQTYPPSTLATAGSNVQETSTYDSYGRGSNNNQSNDQSVGRVAYEPFAAQSSSSSNPYAAYDYTQLNPGFGSGGRTTATTMENSPWGVGQSDGRSQNQSPVYSQQTSYNQQAGPKSGNSKWLEGTTQPNTSGAQRASSQGGHSQQNNNSYGYSQSQKQNSNQDNWYGGYGSSGNRYDWKGSGSQWSGN